MQRLHYAAVCGFQRMENGTNKGWFTFVLVLAMAQAEMSAG